MRDALRFGQSSTARRHEIALQRMDDSGAQAARQEREQTGQTPHASPTTECFLPSETT